MGDASDEMIDQKDAGGDDDDGDDGDGDDLFVRDWPLLPLLVDIASSSAANLPPARREQVNCGESAAKHGS
jgi:hypothetical protein